ncbi:MAG: permease [Mycobacterium sp.]|nr:permease [Mycobacterium sp.]
MTARREVRAGSESPWIRWRARLIGGLALVVALVITYFVLAAFIPRWWAQRIADMSGHGSFAKGIGWGLSLGVLCTAIPLLLLLFAALIWHHRAGRLIAGAAAVLAVIIALPNLMTLSIVLGTNDAAHAAQRILDVNAPGFRGATLIGAIIAVVLSLLSTFAAVRRRRHRRSGRDQQLTNTSPEARQD